MDVTSYSGSANTVTVGSIIAVLSAAPPPDSSNIGAPTADISRVLKAERIIVTANRSTGGASAGRA